MRNKLGQAKKFRAAAPWAGEQSIGQKDPVIHLAQAILRQAIMDARSPKFFQALDAFAWLISDEIEVWLSVMGFSIEPAALLLIPSSGKRKESMLNSVIQDAIDQMSQSQRNRFKRALMREFPGFIQTVAEQVTAEQKGEGLQTESKPFHDQYDCSIEAR